MSRRCDPLTPGAQNETLAMTLHLQDLRESNAFLNCILDNMGAAVLTADENFRIHPFNFLEDVAPDDDIGLLGVEYTGASANHFAI